LKGRTANIVLVPGSAGRVAERFQRIETNIDENTATPTINIDTHNSLLFAIAEGL
jgi:hypothetical protein